MKKLKLILFLMCCIVTVGFARKSYADDAYRGAIKDEIYYAAEHKDTNKLEKYLNLGYSIDEKDVDGFTALCSARAKGEDEIYDLLVKYGANEKALCMEEADDAHFENIENNVITGSRSLLFMGLFGAAIAIGL